MFATTPLQNTTQNIIIDFVENKVIDNQYNLEFDILILLMDNN